MLALFYLLIICLIIFNLEFYPVINYFLLNLINFIFILTFILILWYTIIRDE